MVDEKEPLADRVAAGCFLFCVRSRSRWSDVRREYQYRQDIVEDSGKLSGYLDFRTRDHRTAR